MKIFTTNLVDNIVGLYPAAVLKNLLKDKTTQKNIIWATDEYEMLGNEYVPEHEIFLRNISGFHSGVIKPRITKAIEAQQDRTKKKAEVFTPSWICNKMNNVADEAWFGEKDVFNVEKGESWNIQPNKIKFSQKRTWKQYIDTRRLEITCGEAPFITSRYDTTTGEMIPVQNRIGLLDRKLRIVNENCTTESDWLKWAYRALEAIYGYEYQGDSLLIARINVLQTFVENMEEHLIRTPTVQEVLKATTIIAWNIWQMDGLQGTVPIGKPQDDYYQISLFDMKNENNFTIDKKNVAPACKIYDWRSKETQLFKSLESEDRI